MINLKLILNGLLGFCVSITALCTTSQISGGSSDTEVSAQIAGVATDEYGNVVANAVVKLHCDDFLPSLSDSQLNESSCVSIMGITDEEGRFAFDSIEDGSYLLEVCSGDSAGAISRFDIIHGSRCSLSTVVRPFGTLMGTVSFSYGSAVDITGTRIEAFGLDRTCRPDTNGFFQFFVPQGSYRLKISVDSVAYLPITVDDINVTANGVTPLGPYNLYYEQREICWTYSCDSTLLREFLDSAGYEEVKVTDVTEESHGRIVSLDLSGMLITIPLDDLAQLNALESINLSNTGTTDSCRFVYGLWKLRILNLEGNALTGLSNAIESLWYLNELYLANNRLSSLPQRIYQISHLDSLDLSGNRLCFISPYVAAWADEHDADWRENQQCELPLWWKE